MAPIRGWAPGGQGLQAHVPHGHLEDADPDRRLVLRPHRCPVCLWRADQWEELHRRTVRAIHLCHDENLLPAVSTTTGSGEDCITTDY